MTDSVVVTAVAGTDEHTSRSDALQRLRTEMALGNDKGIRAQAARIRSVRVVDEALVNALLGLAFADLGDEDGYGSSIRLVQLAERHANTLELSLGWRVLTTCALADVQRLMHMHQKASQGLDEVADTIRDQAGTKQSQPLMGLVALQRGRLQLSLGNFGNALMEFVQSVKWLKWDQLLLSQALCHHALAYALTSEEWAPVAADYRLIQAAHMAGYVKQRWLIDSAKLVNQLGQPPRPRQREVDTPRPPRSALTARLQKQLWVT